MAQDYKLEFYVDEAGDAPVHRWLMTALSDDAREVIGAALFEILQAEGADVCGTRFGRQLGEGLFEFRLDGDPQPWIDEARKRRGRSPKKKGGPGEPVKYRLFCHAYGDRIVLLLGAYDKGADVSKRRQQAEIKIARARLREWRLRRRQTAKVQALKKPGVH